MCVFTTVATNNTFFIYIPLSAYQRLQPRLNLKESEPFIPYKALLIVLSSVIHTADMSCTATTLLLHHSLISLRKPLQLLDFLRQSVCFTVFSSSRESLSLFLMTPSSRHRNPCIYARNHSYRYGSPCVYARQHHTFSLGVLVFVPDSISMTGLKVLMILSSKPLVYS